MPDLFISYSRRNSEFVRNLHKMLADDGKDIWVDFEDIPLSSSWWEQICEGIEASDTFVFVLSPDSAASPICNFEIAHALAHNKRIVPIVRQLLDVEDGYTLVLKEALNDSEVQILGTRDLEMLARQTWGSIAGHNWIFFDDDIKIEDSYKKLVQVLETDLDYARTHTRLLVRALEWDNTGNKEGLLLSTSETAEAETWLGTSADKVPHPTPLHLEYVHASRVKHRQRQQRTFAAIVGALAITIVLALVSVGLFFRARTQRLLAEDNASTAVSALDEAQFQANRASTQAAIAEENALTATVAQGEAIVQAERASTQAARAEAQQVRAEENASTATIAQGEALVQAERASTQAAIAESQQLRAENNALTATIAQGEALVQAERASTQAARAEAQQVRAENNASTAVSALDEAQFQANRASTQAAIAEENALTATVAQGEAIVQAEIASTQASIAELQQLRAESNAATATIAQGKAEINGRRAAENALEAETQAALAQLKALEAAHAGETAEANYDIAETARADSQNNADRASTQAVRAATQAAIAELNQLDAEIARQNVSVERDRAQSIALAAFAETQLEIESETDPERGISLALAALEYFDPTWQAERALGLAIAHTLTPASYFQHSQSVTSIEVEPNGEWMISADNSGEVLIWDISNLSAMRVLHRLAEHEGIITSVHFSPDGSRVLTTSRDTSGRIWDTASGQILHRLFGHKDAVLGGVWSPDGSRVLTFSEDGDVIIWDATIGEPVKTMNHFVDVRAADWSVNNLIATGADDGLVRIWSADGELLSSYDGHLLTARQETNIRITSVEFSPDGSLLATGGTDENIHIWNPETLERVALLEGHLLDISQIYWSRDGRWIASVDGLNATQFTARNASARIWNIADDTNRFTLFDHVGVVNAIAWSPNSGRVASVGQDGFLYISDAESGGQLLGLGETEAITIVAWTVNGDTLITGNERGAIRVWDYWASPAELVEYARSCCTPRALTDEEARQFAIPIPTSIPPEVVTIPQCDNGASPQRIYVGTRAQVDTSGSSESLNVRAVPSTGGRIDAQLPPGQTFRIIEGPICDTTAAIAWFKIQFGLDAKTGFVAEGVNGEYFVVPIP